MSHHGIFVVGDEVKDLHNIVAWYYTFKPLFHQVTFFISGQLQTYISQTTHMTLQHATNFVTELIVPLELPFERVVYIAVDRFGLTTHCPALSETMAEIPPHSQVYLFVSAHMYPDTTLEMNHLLVHPQTFLKCLHQPERVVAFVNGCCSWSWHPYFVRFPHSVLFTSASATRPSHALRNAIDKPQWSDFGRATFLVCHRYAGQTIPLALLAGEIRKVAKRCRICKERTTRPCFGIWSTRDNGQSLRLQPWFLPPSTLTSRFSWLKIMQETNKLYT